MYAKKQLQIAVTHPGRLSFNQKDIESMERKK